MVMAYISIGSNLLSPTWQVKIAINALSNIQKSKVITISSFYRTKPMGSQNQPEYLNVAVALETKLTPEIFLSKIQDIEIKQGRLRKKERWGPRTIDLDIMLFGNKIIKTDILTIPHYDIKNRGFMLWPLFEITPELIFPDGESLKIVLSRTNTEKPPIW